VWVAAATDDIIRHDNAALTFVTPPFMVLIGWLFGVEIVKRTRNSKESEVAQDKQQ